MDKILRRFLKKNIPDYAAATGRIRMSHLGNRGLRSKRASTKRIAALLSDTPFFVESVAEFHPGMNPFPRHTRPFYSIGEIVPKGGPELSTGPLQAS
jgi:hypothetical protein